MFIAFSVSSPSWLVHGGGFGYRVKEVNILFDSPPIGFTETVGKETWTSRAPSEAGNIIGSPEVAAVLQVVHDMHD